MNQRSRYLFKNLGILTISNFASKILVFLLVPLYTSILSTAEYGTYDLVVSTVSLMYPLLTVGITDAVMRFCMDKVCSKEQVAAIGIKYITFGIGVVGIGLLGLQWFNLFPSLDGLKGYIFLYYLFYVLNQYFIQLAKGLERVKDMGIAGVLSTVAMIGANLLFLLVLKTGLSGFFAANILAQALPALYYFIRLKCWIFIRNYTIDKKLEKQMLAYCLPLISTALSWWVNSAADKYVVTILYGIAANGILSVSYKIPSIINTLQGIFIQAWQISAIREYGKKDATKFYGSIISHLNILMSIACAGLILLSKPLAHILYAKDFYLAWQYVPFLVISSALNCASGLLGPILSAKKDSKSMAMSAVYGAAANIAMNIVFVYLFGVQGAAVATMLSSYIIYYVRKRAVRNEFVVNNYWKIPFMWLLLCVQAVIEIYTPYWYAEVWIMAVLLILSWSELRTTLEMIVNKKLRNKRGQ